MGGKSTPTACGVCRSVSFYRATIKCVHLTLLFRSRYVAGANGLLKAGGAQAIGAFAYGAGQVPICDAIVGPGNKFVTAAKSLVAGAVGLWLTCAPGFTC